MPVGVAERAADAAQGVLDLLDLTFALKMETAPLKAWSVARCGIRTFK